MTDLFNPKTVNRLCRDVVLTKKQKESAKQWLKLLKENKLKKEQENYGVLIKMNLNLFYNIFLLKMKNLKN